MRLAGKYADGLVTDPLTWKKHKAEWEAGAREAGKDPSNMPVLVEQYVVVGGQSEAQAGGGALAIRSESFQRLFQHPRSRRHSAGGGEGTSNPESRGRLDHWNRSLRPHIAKVRELWESGATIVNIHSGQHDQRKVVEFYGSKVLPNLGRA